MSDNTRDAANDGVSPPRVQNQTASQTVFRTPSRAAASRDGTSVASVLNQGEFGVSTKLYDQIKESAFDDI